MAKGGERTREEVEDAYDQKGVGEEKRGKEKERNW